MLRVLLVLEDYGELMFLQTILKKIGFDADSTQSVRGLADSVLTLNPDVLVMTALGKRVRGVDLVPKIKKIRGLPSIILIRSGTMAKEPYAHLEVNGWLESPVGAPDLLAKIAELHGLDNRNLQEKLLKLRMQESGPDSGRVLNLKPVDSEVLDQSAKPSGNFGVLKASKMSSADRQARFKKFAENTDIERRGFALKEVQAQVRALRDEEAAADLEDLERQRRAFVEHLFKKKVG